MARDSKGIPFHPKEYNPDYPRIKCKTCGLMNSCTHLPMDAEPWYPRLPILLEGGMVESIDDFVLQGALLATKKVNDKFKWGLGIVHSTRWGTPIVVPSLNFHYKHKKHDLNALLPIKIQYTHSYLPKDKLKLGFKYIRNGADFNITTDFSNYNKINYSRANIGLIAMYQPRKIFRFELHTGISTGRVYRLVDYDRNVSKFDSKAEPFINIGFSIVPPKRD